MMLSSTSSTTLVFAVDNPKTDFSLKNPCCPPLPLQPKFSKSAATRRGKRSARGARAIDPPRDEKNEFEPYFLRFFANLGVKSTPFLRANEVSCHDFKPHESVIKCNYRSGSQSGIPQEYDYA